MSCDAGVTLAVVARVPHLRAPPGPRARAFAPPRLHVAVVCAAVPPLVRMHHGAHAAEEVRVYELAGTLIKMRFHLVGT